MTATAIMFASGGFALAADGNQLWGDKPTRTAAIRAIETDSAQKVFGIEAGDVVLAYIVGGSVANEDRTFDAAAELSRTAESIAKKRLTTPKAFVAAVGAAMEATIDELVQLGRLQCWPRLDIPFIGFFASHPFYLTLYFYHVPYPSGLHHVILGQAFDDWLFAYSGSEIVGQMLQRSDARIAHRIKSPDEHPSLQDAVDMTRGYIEACSSPLGLEVDPDNCQGLGGHIHVATVTPVQRPSWFARHFRGAVASGGFTWVIPPKSDRR
jgi:hypothetical protein